MGAGHLDARVARFATIRDTGDANLPTNQALSHRHQRAAIAVCLEPWICSYCKVMLPIFFCTFMLPKVGGKKRPTILHFFYSSSSLNIRCAPRGLRLVGTGSRN